MRRLVLWSGLDSWRAEMANLEVKGDRLAATGTQIGADPVAYRLDYSLDTGPAFITQVLTVEASGEGWGRQLRTRSPRRRQLDLRHHRAR